MNSRREFIQTSGFLFAGIVITPLIFAEPEKNSGFVSLRPPPEKRRFTSQAVEAKILEVQKQLKDPEIAWLFGNCFPNTLDTTITLGELNGKPDTYVITGDIHAMWLRDSAAQVWPYLPLMKEDPALEKLIQGVINRHAHCVQIDPYANAFYRDEKQLSPHRWDKTEIRPGVHERKWEIDSLCYVIRLAHGYWKAGGDPACFDAEWLVAAKLIVQTFKEQQRKKGVGPYTFELDPKYTNGKFRDGYGDPVQPNGLISSHFRPSDDATKYPFLIPSNFFAVQSLRQLAEMVQTFYEDPAFAQECSALADEVHQALKKNAVVEQKTFGKIFAYEMDGLGGVATMDDSNVPSLLSLPYLDAILPENLSIYQNTRRFLLSDENYYFRRGTAAEGISGPHAGRDKIWPMSLIMRAMTSTDDAEISQSIQFLKKTHAGTGFMHEAFDKDDPTKFTRKWFAWANTLFGEFILQVLADRPHLLT